MNSTPLAIQMMNEFGVKVPAELSWNINDMGFITNDERVLEMQVHANTQEQVKLLRSAFPGVWKKTRRDSLGWWDYSIVVHPNLRILTLGCTENPPTCRLIEEEVEVIEQVPVAFTEEVRMVQVPVQYEERQVKKTVSRWVCDDPAESLVTA